MEPASAPTPPFDSVASVHLATGGNVVGVGSTSPSDKGVGFLSGADAARTLYTGRGVKAIDQATPTYEVGAVVPRPLPGGQPILADDGTSLCVAYVARTGDVQSIALLFCHAVHLAKPPTRLSAFFVQYAALLARWRLRRQRAGLHTLLASRLPPDESFRRQGPVLHCSACQSALTGPLPSLPGDVRGDVDAIMRRCPNVNCAKAAPACAVCLLPCFVVRASGEDSDRASKSISLAVENWVAWCQHCHHGGHVQHLEEWFAVHTECPVAGCECHCGMY